MVTDYARALPAATAAALGGDGAAAGLAAHADASFHGGGASGLPPRRLPKTTWLVVQKGSEHGAVPAACLQLLDARPGRARSRYTLVRTRRAYGCPRFTTTMSRP